MALGGSDGLAHCEGRSAGGPFGCSPQDHGRLRRLAELDDPEGTVVQILIDAIMLVESYRGARHQITFLPELTRSIDELLREFEILERAEKMATE